MTCRSLIALLCAVLLAGCGTSRESARPDESREPVDASNPYEKDFNPADHDPNIHILLGEDRDSTQQHSDLPPGIPPSPTAEVVSGFQVQLFSSTDIDETRTKKAEAQALFQNEWIYLVFDPPTYKLRAGNFLSRFEAERFLKDATEKGYTDAWVVPAKVFRNPPPPSGQPKYNESYHK